MKWRKEQNRREEKKVGEGDAEGDWLLLLEWRLVARGGSEIDGLAVQGYFGRKGRAGRREQCCF